MAAAVHTAPEMELSKKGQNCQIRKKFLLWVEVEGWLVEMSSSWNFPARASPSCENFEPSRAELGHFNFRAETELDLFLSIAFLAQKKKFFFAFTNF